MKWKPAFYIFLIIIGIADIILNGWLYLLEPQVMTLLQLGIGIICVVAGGVSLRRLQQDGRNAPPEL